MRRRPRPLPLARRSAAGDRAGCGTNQDAVDRGDHPAPRRSASGAERPDQPPTGTPPVAEVDDPLELRAAVPRRPARPLGTRHLRWWRALPAVEFVLEALDVPAAAAIDVVGRLASRSLVIVDEDHGAFRGRPIEGAAPLDPVQTARQHPRVRAGGDDRGRDGRRSRWPRTPHGSRTQPRPPHRACAAAARPSICRFARAERANIDAALAWSAAHDPLLALDIVNGFGWAWVVLGDSRGAQRILTALDAVGDAGPPRDRASALLLAAWIEASTGHLELARDHIAAATELAEAIDDVDLQSAVLLLPGLRRVALRRVPSRDGADRSQQCHLRRRWTGRGTRPRAGCSPPGPRSPPVTRSAASRPRDQVQRWVRRWRIRGCTFAARRCSASSPGSSTGSTMLCCTSAVQRTPPGVSVFSRRRRTR